MSWEKVKVALENPKYTWRTIRGISKETGLNSLIILSVLAEHSNFVAKSSIKAESGEDLYSTYGHLSRKSKIFERLLSSLTGSTYASLGTMLEKDQ